MFAQIVLWIFGFAIMGFTFVSTDELLYIFLITLAISQFIITAMISSQETTPTNTTRCQQLIDRFTKTSVISLIIAITTVIIKTIKFKQLPIGVLLGDEEGNRNKMIGVFTLAAYYIFSFVMNSQGVVLAGTQG